MQAIRTNEKRPKTKTAGNGLFAAGPGENELCRFQGQPVVCGPRGLPGGTNILYRQRDDKFVNVSRKSGFDSPSGYYGFSVLTGDFDGDGWGDVYIACDSAPSILFRNNHDGAFSDIGLLSGAALNEHGKEQGGMGADSADYNGDGLPDISKPTEMLGLEAQHYVAKNGATSRHVSLHKETRSRSGAYERDSARIFRMPQPRAHSLWHKAAVAISGDRGRIPSLALKAGGRKVSRTPS